LARTDLRVGLLGPFECTLDGQPLAVPRGGQRILLAALALAAGRLVSVDALSAMMWESQPPEDPKAAVQNNVRRLRKILPPDTIVTLPGGYQLDIAADQLDILEFFALVSEPSPDALERGLALWRGEPLTGVGSPQLEKEHKPALWEHYLAAVERLADLRIAAGQSAAILPRLRELVAQHPLRESLWQRLLTALHELGRSAEALAAYEEVRTFLAEELGTDPAPELRQLHRMILTDDRPAGPDLSAALHAPWEPPHQLPPPPAELVGRDEELAVLDELAAEVTSVADGWIVCTIHGAGGAGKTALAVWWSHRASSLFPDGRLYVDLAGYGPDEPTGAESALGTLLQAVGVPADRLPSGTAARSALLRTKLAGRRILLLLDNARDAEQVRPLLPGGNSLVLVTSRSQLRGLTIRDGARRLPVGQLSATDAMALLERAICPARIAAEQDAANRLVEVCGGLPLALWIVAEMAGRHPDLPLDHVVSAITAPDGPGVLATSQDSATDLEAVFSWSYRTLSEETARLFRCLGLSPASTFSVPAAAALLGVSPSEARSHLDRLVAIHLLEQLAPDRFALHDLLHEYARRAALTEDTEPSRRACLSRLLDWYLHTAANARAQLGSGAPFSPVTPCSADVQPLTFGGGADAGSWFDAELGALSAVLQAADRAGFDQHGWQLGYVVRNYLDRRLLADHAMAAARVALSCAQRVGEPLALFHAYHALGSSYWLALRNDDALESFRAALRFARELANKQFETTARSDIGLLLGDTGRIEDAIAYHTEAVTQARLLGDPLELARCLLNAGATLCDNGRPEAAIEPTTEAIELFTDLGDASRAATSRANLAIAYERAGHPDRALTQGRLALGPLLDRGVRFGAAELLTSLGRACRALGDEATARRHWTDAHALLHSGHPLAIELEHLLDTCRPAC
jgi:DNA-binding SARP family transcriptional activator